MNRAAGIIPARWASTRFPGKPLHLIANKPLLWHVWERCRRAKKLDAVIIATDDMRIARAAFDWGAEVAMTSPLHQSGTDRIAEVACRDLVAGMIVLLHDSPRYAERASALATAEAVPEIADRAADLGLELGPIGLSPA